MGRRIRAAAIILTMAAGIAMPAGALGAATVSYSPATGLLVQGGAAAENVRVDVRSDGVQVFTMNGVPLVVGSGCQPRESSGLQCPRSFGQSRAITVDLGDGDDEVALLNTAEVSAFGLSTVIDGGAGDDRLFGSIGSDVMDGGPGRDEVVGGPGDDVIEGGDGNDLFMGDFGATSTIRGEGGNDTFRARADASRSADNFDGGPGVDVADYALRTAPVILQSSLPSKSPPDDGAPGEGDRLDNVETLVGGSGADTIVMANTLSAAATAPAATHTLRGNGGADAIRVLGPVRTILDGGAGGDAITGGSAEDAILSRDGEADTIICGKAIDTLTSDLKDKPPSKDCENVSQGDRREGPGIAFLTTIARVDEEGLLRVRLACPRAVPIGCRGTLVARIDRSGARFGAPESYALLAGRSTAVEVALPARQIAGARAKTARLRVRSVEAGVHGPKTTQRSLPSRAG